MSKYPFVSLCTPTFNRRHFFPILFEMFKLQTYPKERMEWIIIDDGTDKIGDLIKTSGIKQITYIELPEKLKLGKKRNLMHNYCKGSIIIYVDDDDYFPPERVSHSVELLMNSKNGELIAGSSEIYLYFKDKGLYQFGPYRPNHATAGTFAFKRELLEITRYDDNVSIGEESYFLKNYTIPMIQLNPIKTILVFPHNHNTFDKVKLLDNYNENFGPIKKCVDKSIDNFIKGDKSILIKDFFLNKMHKILLNYKEGEPNNKPDVILQTKEIEIKRNKIELEKMNNLEDINNKNISKMSNKELYEEIIKRDCIIQKLNDYIKEQKPVMLMTSDKKTIPLTNEQIYNIIMEQQLTINKQKEIIDNMK